MQQEKKNNLTAIIISWALVFICMAIIFWLSSKTADESAAQSSVIVKWIINHFGKKQRNWFYRKKTCSFFRIRWSVLFGEQCNISIEQTFYSALFLRSHLFLCNKRWISSNFCWRAFVWNKRLGNWYSRCFSRCFSLLYYLHYYKKSC